MSEDKKDDVKAEGEKADKDKNEVAENGVANAEEKESQKPVVNGGGEGDGGNKQLIK